MPESEYEPVGQVGRPSAPCHVSTILRPNELHRSIRQCGFASLAEALDAELLSEDRGAASKRAVAFCSGFECTQLLATIVSSKRPNRGYCRSAYVVATTHHSSLVTRDTSSL